MNSSKEINVYNNWKIKEVDKLIKLKEDMIRNNIDKNIINIYMEKEYEKINEKYNIKVEKYYKNQNKKKENNNSIINKKKKALNLLIKSKLTLEQYNINPEYIKINSEKQYNKINNLTSLNSD